MSSNDDSQESWVKPPRAFKRKFFVDRIVERHKGLKKDEAADIVDTIMLALRECVMKDRKVDLPTLGALKVHGVNETAIRTIYSLRLQIVEDDDLPEMPPLAQDATAEEGANSEEDQPVSDSADQTAESPLNAEASEDK